MDRVLIVEDDKEIARIIRYYLSQDNLYEVVSAASAEEALFLARDAYDIILLDVGLPDQSGIDLCAQLRQWHDCPILFISCLDDNNTIISALQQGGDDYIVKPFEVAELVARVESVLRRTGRGGALLRAWDVTVDTVARSATKAGVPVALTPREFDLLEQLLRNRGAALYRDVLFERVWGGEMDDGTRTLDLHIQRLRKKLGWQEHIKTVYKVGYLLEMEGEP